MKRGFSTELWKVLESLTTHLKSNVQICRFLSLLHKVSPQYPSVLICYQLWVGSPRYFVALGTLLKKHIKASHIQSDTENYRQIIRKQCCIVDTFKESPDRINWLYSLTVSLTASQLFGSSSIIHLCQDCHYNQSMGIVKYQRNTSCCTELIWFQYILYQKRRSQQTPKNLS